MHEDVPARQAMALYFEGRNLEGGKEISVKLHLVCQMTMKKQFIRALKQNPTTKMLLWWRKIGCSGNKLLRLRVTDVLSELSSRGEKSGKRP